MPQDYDLYEIFTPLDKALMEASHLIYLGQASYSVLMIKHFLARRAVFVQLFIPLPLCILFYFENPFN